MDNCGKNNISKLLSLHCLRITKNHSGGGCILAKWGNKTAVIITFLFAATYAQLAYSKSYSAYNEQQCWSTTVQSQNYVKASSLTQFLNCLASLPKLTKLGAQWIFLTKAHWEFTDSYGHWETYTAPNPSLPYAPNFLGVKENHWETDKESFQFLMDKLQNEVFKQIINEFSKDSSDNKSALAFQATMYQLIAFMDTPLPYWKKKENARVHYKGTLVESKNFPNDWWQVQVGKHPYLNWIINKNNFWPEMRNTIKQDYLECKTACFLRQERKILEALFVALEHPDFIQKVHFSQLTDFGPDKDEFANAQSSLPQQYGCYADYPHQDSPTGLRSYDFNWTGNDWRPNYLEMGKWALIGRPIYIEAINKTQINPSVKRVPARHNGRSFSDVPAHYAGQNAIIRSMSDAAVKSLIKLGGLGGSSTIEDIDGRVYQREGITASAAIEKHLTKASYLFADYQRKKHLGESVKDHAVVKEAFFNETIITKGHSLKTWADILSKLNPAVYYHIFAYDYEFMPRPGVPWRSYYDRVAKVLETEFNLTKL